jgi:hypothetical protein
MAPWTPTTDETERSTTMGSHDGASASRGPASSSSRAASADAVASELAHGQVRRTSIAATRRGARAAHSTIPVAIANGRLVTTSPSHRWKR